jgi:hypothetical protein
VVTSGVSVGYKGKCGRVNASKVLEVGDGGNVAEELLAGDPFEGSAYDGYYQTIEVEAHYPVSRYVPAQPPDTPASWERVREIVLKWTRTHTGDAVIPCDQQPDYEDEYTQEGYPLAEDEAIIPGSDEDPEGFGTGYLSLISSKLTLEGQVTKEQLLSYVNDLPEGWQEYGDVAPADFDIFGQHCSGIIFDQGYEEGGHPSRASLLYGKWTVLAFGGGSPGIWDGPPMMGDPGYTLFQQVTLSEINLADEEPQFMVMDERREGMPWRESLSVFARAVGLGSADVEEGIGWEVLNEDMTPGIVILLDGYSYSLDLGTMLLI